MRMLLIPEPGDVVVVAARRDYDLCTSNDMGGTENLPAGRYRVRIQKTWDDYETGQRCIGILLDAQDIATSRRVGTTQWTPKRNKDWHPERVYFHASEIAPESKPCT